MTAVAVEPPLETVPCPACGAGVSTVVHEGRDWSIDDAAGTLWRIVRCDECGLHYTNPRPAASDLARHYPEDYAPHRAAVGQHAADEADGAVRTLVLRQAYGAPALRPRRLRRVLACGILLTKPARLFGFGVPWHGLGRLLDFGCGAGKFLRRMHTLGWAVTGVDASPVAVEAVRAGGLTAYHGSLPHADLRPGEAAFDVVTMRHALEHVPDPLAVLRAARDLLAPGGRVVIQVPNYASWETSTFGDASPLLELPRHLTHFTPETLRSMLERAGFRVLDLHTFCRANWLKRAARRARERGDRSRAARLLRHTTPARLAAQWQELRDRGNEIVAVADVPPRGGEAR